MNYLNWNKGDESS
uniref:Uncharacterized protein n=1 Tax=Anguilla anguilla TaxID=7936 RepID=A0A0E9PBL1_ANGAN